MRYVKQKARIILSEVGLEEVAEHVWRKFKPAPQHGHSLLIRVINSEKNKLATLPPWQKTLVEIGSTRENLPGQGSTAVLAKLCHNLKIRFITVDMDPENTRNAKISLEKYNAPFQAINSKGEDFLSDHSGEIDYLYLDAFDFYHSWHSEKRQQAYRKFLGTDINDQECWKMHYDCCYLSNSKMPKKGVIVFDDTWEENQGWGGKGKTAIPFLLEKGFTIIHKEEKCVALRK